MPKNNDLKPKTFPMDIRFGELPTTEFKNNLQAIKVDLIQSPTNDALKAYCIPFANATWADNPFQINEMSKHQKDLMLYHIFKGKILPTTMETIRLNFYIEGISLQEVTHILRYRKAVFSAECSGDKWLTHKPALVPTAIENTPEIYERYKQIVEDCKELYIQMIDSELITVQDARTILPRCIETFYFMSMSLKDAIQFITDRVDKQIQPQTDNILAYRMMQELVRRYPLLAKIFIEYIHQPSKFYVQTARQARSTNWYPPDADSDVFEWNEKDFIYNKERNKINGKKAERTVFEWILEEVEKELGLIVTGLDFIYGPEYFDQDINYE